MIIKLDQSIAYQEGTIVSKVIIKANGGNVTLFAFSAGAELSEHTAPFDAFVQCLEGEAEIKLKGEPYLLKQGESLIMPAGIPHAVKAHSNFKMLLTMIKK